ncbi:MAG: hypothetical protein NVS3B14_17570 [Ktedonobacteraceae bacterium]
MTQHTVRSHSRPHLPNALFLTALLSILLLSQILSNWSFLIQPAEAASLGVRPSAPSQMTFQQFLKEGRQDKVYHGPLMHSAALPSSTRTQHALNNAPPLPSAEPATMKSITQVLTATFLAGGSPASPGTPTSPLDLRGSDGRLEVRIAPGTFDVSQATRADGAQPVAPLSLQLSQLRGYFAGQSTSLGSYQLQLLDSQGQALSGVHLRQPITIIYHYQQAAMDALDLDAGRIILAVPTLIAAAVQAKCRSPPSRSPCRTIRPPIP